MKRNSLETLRIERDLSVYLQINRLAGIHNSIGDGGAVDDASEHIDKDGLDLVILCDDPEGLLDLVLLDAAAHIEEVGRLAPVQLDDVHCGHGQPGAVHEAPDVPIQLDIVKAVLGGLHLPRVGLSGVLHVEDVLLSEGGVVIKPKLGISCVNLNKGFKLET